MTKRTRNNSRAQRARSQPHPWLKSLTDPFGQPGAHIPDDNTISSGICRSFERFTFTPRAYATATTTHTGGMLFRPHPQFYRSEFAESAGGSGTYLDVGITGTTAPLSQASVPNFTSLCPSQATLRLTSMGVKVTYQGTELQRAGQVTMGLLPIAHPASTVLTTGTFLSPLSTVTGAASTTFNSLISAVQMRTTARNADAPMVYHWKPSGVPHYQGASFSTADMLPSTTSLGVQVDPSVYHAPVGAQGTEAGQYALVMIIDGDQTAAANTVGNNYIVEAVCHWEVIPIQQQAIAYELSPSPFNPMALAQCLNSIEINQSGGIDYGAFRVSQASNSPGGYARGPDYPMGYIENPPGYFDEGIRASKQIVQNYSNQAMAGTAAMIGSSLLNMYGRAISGGPRRRIGR